MTDFGRKTVYRVYPEILQGFGWGMVLVTSVESLKSWIISKELGIDYLWITPVFISQ